MGWKTRGAIRHGEPAPNCCRRPFHPRRTGANLRQRYLQQLAQREARGQEKAAEFFERRFRDEYRPAFTAWLSTDPFNNPQAPAGPIFMPDYHNAKHEEFLGLSKKATDTAEQGTKSGETGDQYVRITVLLATVLLITAIGQRFRFKAARVAFMIFAWLLLCLPLWQLLMLPRI